MRPGLRCVAGGPPGQGKLARITQDPGQRLCRRQLPGRLSSRPQRAPQPPQAKCVGAAEGPGQQLGRGLLVKCTWPQRAAQQLQQRARAWLGGQRQLVAGHGHRDTGRGEDALEQRHLPGSRPDQNRHRRPADPVDQVGAAKRVGDHGRFLGGARRDDDTRRSRIGLRERHNPAVVPFRGKVVRSLRGRQPAGDPARGGKQDFTAAPGRAQGHHLRRPAVGRAEPIGKAPERADVGAAEAVDRLVWIADHDQLPAIPGQGVQHVLLRGVSVLVLIDEYDVVSPPFPVPGHAAGQQAAGDPDDLGVVIGRNRREVEPGRIGVKEPAGRHPVVAAAPGTQPGQTGPVQPALGRAEEEVP